ncbi:MAG TPA: hypothetical protein VGO39_14205 [Gaiellaceae bacterium]|jgi:hypothetical protein|nr:hypothetical protein [Gaiellaceae bacterium]
MQFDVPHSALVATDQEAAPAAEAIGPLTPVDDLVLVAQPSGPAAAAILSVGVAALVLGVLSTLTAASTSVSNVLTWSDRVGDLSGVTTLAIAVFFGAWGVLALAWRNANPPLRTVVIVSTILLGLSLVGTFPPFFHAFEPG